MACSGCQLPAYKRGKRMDTYRLSSPSSESGQLVLGPNGSGWAGQLVHWLGILTKGQQQQQHQASLPSQSCGVRGRMRETQHQTKSTRLMLRYSPERGEGETMIRRRKNTNSRQMHHVTCHCACAIPSSSLTRQIKAKLSCYYPSKTRKGST